MGQLSELHSKLLQLRLEARALVGEAQADARSPAIRGATESKALAEAAENLCHVLDALYGKANFNPNQPRVPRGNPDGGQWTNDPSSGGSKLQTGRSAVRTGPPRTRKRSIKRPPKLPDSSYSLTPDGHIRVTIHPRPQGWRDTGEPPPRGDNSGFPDPLSEIPDVPRERPPTAKQRHSIVKTVARAGLRLVRALSPLGRIMDLFEVGHWLYEEFSPYLEAYWAEPKTLEELKRDAVSPAKGYDIHHIVEQTPAKRDGYSRTLIDGPDNIVRIPTLKHWQITAWYMIPNEDYGGLSPRTYLRGKDWATRTRVGRKALIKNGVVKP